MLDQNTHEDIGSVRARGETIRVHKKYATYGYSSPGKGEFLGYVLEGSQSIEVAPGESVPLSVFIPRDAIDRLCGLLQSDLTTQERHDINYIKMRS